MDHFSHYTFKIFVIGVLLFFTGISVVVPQIPSHHHVPTEKCFMPGTYELSQKRCCILPPFFANEVSRSCGAYGVLQEAHSDDTDRAHFRRTGLDCNTWACILDKYHLLSEKQEYVDMERIDEHLDRWLRLNEEFNTTLSRAKIVCRKLFATALPLKICEYKDYQGCLRNYINSDCPVTVDTKECNEQKEYFEECREYLFMYAR